MENDQGCRGEGDMLRSNVTPPPRHPESFHIRQVFDVIRSISIWGGIGDFYLPVLRHLRHRYASLSMVFQCYVSCILESRYNIVCKKKKGMDGWMEMDVRVRVEME